MNVVVEKDAQGLGARAAEIIAGKLKEAIAQRGHARLLLSTGASQFTTIEALIKTDLDWSKVTMFHLDEYVGLSGEHPASFRKYLKERFTDHLPLERAVFISGEGDLCKNVREISQLITQQPIDVGVIGIGQNAHIAFNDPPADFDTKRPYLIVALDERCKYQQVSEGWFKTVEEVPQTAVSISPYQIMQCRCVVSPVPYAVKAQAIADTLSSAQVDNKIPATLLKTHGDFHLLLDADSASLCGKELLSNCTVV